MAEKRKPGRPPKYVGLAPPLRKVVDRGDTLHDLRSPAGRQEEPVLRPSREGDAAEAPQVRVFATPNDSHGGRGAEAQQATLPGATVPLDTELRVSALIKNILAEVAADRYQEDGTRMSNAEVLTRGLVAAALEGKQFAIEAVLDRYEGKPVRANQVQTADTTVEEQIDRQSVALLNQIAEKK